MSSRGELVVVGGGLAGLVAAVTAAEAGADVRLLEAHPRLGGRARSTPAPFVANDGPHVLYADGPAWAWLSRRGLTRPSRRLSFSAAGGIRFRRDGRLRAAPPAGLLRLLAGRARTAPVGTDFRSWVAGVLGDEAAAAASSFAGVVTYTADPGRLSAAFVWERLLRVTNPTGGPRYLVGGWAALVDRLADHARGLGVRIEVGSPVPTLPDGPTVVATSLPAVRTLLGRPLATPAVGGSTMLLDVVVERRRGDAFIVSDLDEAGWLEGFSRVDPTLAPAGCVLVQAHRPLREGEDRAASSAALEEFVGLGVPGWRGRTVWRRDAVARGRTGALDLPGCTWRDRPGIDQGDDVFLAGDEVAAPGLLAEVSVASAVTAATAAAERLARAGGRRRTGPRAARRA
ncbi:FAD-dependent oxidoreductase [Geodermatophilus sp. TF02-6]|uniref:FAD-dependent oxidoreductase n=1 Tax=Geodermatophilus sp. TF02-6 TaxID=2250575 RepID=UPI000DE9DC28|nr:FAD-dependent oxidoreductase [Geodermatophilus sp. TF02-6]RBY77259.1 FAD-dependent oxidoreductase [Geodermatophilus sp. TF02-6]